jgi:hydroxymethylpyrimidine pyrophosphatase-like HAD family hydrolase
MNSIKVGFDIHGVIDRDPVLFAKLTRKLKESGHQVHILTGRELGEEILSKLNGLDIVYDQLFSITSYHKAIGTYITYKDGDITQPLISPPKWDRTKADYADREGLDVHFDDSTVYGDYFTKNTQYILYTPYIRTFLSLLLGEN